MSARLPLLHKTPFVLDGRPLQEATSPHAGVLSISRAYRSLGVPATGRRQSHSAQTPARLLRGADSSNRSPCSKAWAGNARRTCVCCLGMNAWSAALGYELPSVTAVREFLERFHDKDLEKLRPEAGSAEEFHFSFQPAGGRFAGSAKRAGAADCQAV